MSRIAKAKAGEPRASLHTDLSSLISVIGVIRVLKIRHRIYENVYLVMLRVETGTHMSVQDFQ